MKDQIRTNINDPKQLEKLYRADKPAFKSAFNDLYPEFEGNVLMNYWNERLNFESEEVSWDSNRDLQFVIIASIIAGLSAKIPAFFTIDEEFFYSRNIGFIVFPLLTAYFAWKNKLSSGKITFLIGATSLGLVFINLFPDVKKSDTLTLSCVHLLLFLWSVLGCAFVGDRQNNAQKRLGFLKYNGDLAVITGLILIAGIMLTGITIGLFSLIGFRIEKFYFEYIAVFGLAAAPIVGTYLTHNNLQLVSKVSPVIAKLFSPLVAVMLVVYLIAIVYSGKDPYNDREFLMIFNFLLIGVMALIFFSVAETSKSKNRTESWILLILSVLTIMVNSVALSAILFRISEWGMTPNRAAVLGSNVLILIHLLMVTRQLFKVISKEADRSFVGKAIAVYLPVYFVWTTIVTFIFPLLFGFK